MVEQGFPEPASGVYTDFSVFHHIVMPLPVLSSGRTVKTITGIERLFPLAAMSPIIELLWRERGCIP